MIAAGIDLGGTKSEIRIFDQDWRCVAVERAATPSDYAALIARLADQIAWAERKAGAPLPLGLAAPGRVGPDGRLIAANLAAKGQDLAGDLSRRTGRPLHFVNDAQAFALSEARLGAGRGARALLGLILGTGIGGATVYDGALPAGASPCFGEFGHSPISARVALAYDLDLPLCGCGRRGCVETLGSGRGMLRLAEKLTGEAWRSEDVAALRQTDPLAAKIWQVWLALIADLALSLTLASGAERIVLGGGLSQMTGLAPSLQDAVAAVQVPGFPVPQIVLAEGGDASGARGAALAAWQAQGQKIYA